MPVCERLDRDASGGHASTSMTDTQLKIDVGLMDDASMRYAIFHRKSKCVRPRTLCGAGEKSGEKHAKRRGREFVGCMRVCVSCVQLCLL